MAEGVLGGPIPGGRRAVHRPTGGKEEEASGVTASGIKQQEMRSERYRGGRQIAQGLTGGVSRRLWLFPSEKGSC